MQNIVVSSNCQTAGVALALKAMLPGANVKAAPLIAPGGKGFDELSEAVSAADTWVTSAGNDIMSAIKDQPKAIRFPQLEFDAFHPDIIYAKKPGGGHAKGAGNSDYHSYIALWAFQNELSVNQCLSLFNNKTFDRIGYFDRWLPNVEIMRRRFDATDIRFDDFFRQMIHVGPFMHTLNHPAGMAIVQLSRLIARRIGGHEALISAPLERTLQDTLATGTVWPVYPAIAERFGIDGSYVWKIGLDNFFTSLRAYVEESYRAFEAGDAKSWRAPRLDDANMTNAMRVMAGA